MPADGKPHYLQGVGNVRRKADLPNYLFAASDRSGNAPAMHFALDPGPTEGPRDDPPDIGGAPRSREPQPLGAPGSLYALPTATDDPVCTPDGARRIYVVYAYPNTIASRFADKVATIRNVVRRMNQKLIDEGYRSSGGRHAAQMRVRCQTGTSTIFVSDIQTVGNAGGSGDPDPNAAINIRNSVQAVLGTPVGSTARKYLIFHERDDGRGVGFGYIFNRCCWTNPENYSKDPNVNPNSNNTTSAITYELQWQTHTPLHELGHTLGAVQDAYPASTYAGHCVDGIDVMCYNDSADCTAGALCGGARYTEIMCPAALFGNAAAAPFDCNKNTYFDTEPEGAAVDYLSVLWNIGGPENGFFHFT